MVPWISSMWVKGQREKWCQSFPHCSHSVLLSLTWLISWRLEPWLKSFGFRGLETHGGESVLLEAGPVKTGQLGWILPAGGGWYRSGLQRPFLPEPCPQLPKPQGGGQTQTRAGNLFAAVFCRRGTSDSPNAREEPEPGATDGAAAASLQCAHLRPRHQQGQRGCSGSF